MLGLGCAFSRNLTFDILACMAVFNNFALQTSKSRSARTRGATGNRLYKYSIKERNNKKVKRAKKRTG